MTGAGITNSLRTPEVLLFQRVEALAGAELSMFRILQDLPARGFRVAAALYGSAAARIAREYPELNPVVVPVRRTREAILPLARLLRSGPPRIVVSALTMTNCAAALATSLSRTSTRLVQTEHNPIAARFGRDGAQLGRLRLGVLRKAYGRADVIIAVSSGLAREIADITRQAVRPRVIYNPVVDSEPRPYSACPHPWFATGEPPCILTMGRLSPEKGYVRLLEAFAQLRRDRACRLILLGEGPQRMELEALRDRLQLADRVLLPGFVAAPQDWLRHGSLYVCSSDYEGFGNAIVEAMQCGLPVVSTDCPFGPTEILEGGRWGRLVPVGRIDLLAAAIAEVLRQPADPAALSQRAGMFSRKRSVDAYAALLSELL